MIVSSRRRVRSGIGMGVRSSRRSLRSRVRQHLDNLDHVGIECVSDLAKPYDVEASLPGLIVMNKGMMPTKLAGDLLLGKTGLPPQPSQ
jgi:hypothetical protein